MADKITEKCMCCGKTKYVDKFNKCNFNTNGYEVYCKDCKTKEINNKEQLIEYLKMNNTEFNEMCWQDALSWVKNREMKKIGNKDVPDDFETQVFKKSIGRYYSQSNLTGNYQATGISKTKKIKNTYSNKELAEKWGKEFNDETLNNLETLFNEMMLSFKIESAAQRDYLKKICITSTIGDIELKAGNLEKAQKWIKMYDDLMKSSKMAPVQASSADSMGVNTFSQFVEMVEKQGFIPFYSDVPQDDIDYAILCFINYNRKLIGLNQIDLDELKTELDDVDGISE